MNKSREFDVTVLRGGQVTIPKDVRAKHKIEPGTKIVMQVVAEV